MEHLDLKADDENILEYTESNRKKLMKLSTG